MSFCKSKKLIFNNRQKIFRADAMPIFGRKKKPELVQEAKELVERLEKEEKVEKAKVVKPSPQTAVQQPPVSAQPVVSMQPGAPTQPAPVEAAAAEEKQEKPEFAPLFVRLNRYRQILRTMNYLKNTIAMVRSGLAILKEMDKLREENLKLIESSVEKVEKRLLSLDSEFMRPSGYEEEMPELQLQDVGSLEDTLTDLKTQIDQLKAELERMA